MMRIIILFLVAIQQISACEIYLIRHGETDWNREGRLQGHTDIELNEKGEAQALQLRKELAEVTFDAAFSSDLKRAKRTAEVVLDSQDLPIYSTPLLRERFFGAWEGRLNADLKAAYCVPAVVFSQSDYLNFKWEQDVETLGEVYLRVSTFLREQALGHPDERLLVAAHGGVLRSFLYMLDFHEGCMWQVANCAFMKLHIDKEGNISIYDMSGISLQNESPNLF